MLLSVDDTASPPEKVAHARRRSSSSRRSLSRTSVLARAVADHRAMAADEPATTTCCTRNWRRSTRRVTSATSCTAHAHTAWNTSRRRSPRTCSSATTDRRPSIICWRTDGRRPRPRRTTSGLRGEPELPADTAGEVRTRGTDFAHRGSQSQPPSARRGAVAARHRADAARSLEPTVRCRRRGRDRRVRPSRQGGPRRAQCPLAVDVSWQELRAAVRCAAGSRRVHPDQPTWTSASTALSRFLITRGLARYRLDPVFPHPVSTPVRLDEAVRRMAELTRDDDEAFVFNHWHESVPLSPLDRHLLPLLDGNHDRDALLDAMVDLSART